MTIQEFIARWGLTAIGAVIAVCLAGQVYTAVRWALARRR